ncbi:MAG: nucleotidyltransferase family protein, partial [Actinomycetota bacterium]|nr:nucleotidyltransferase family protein [Actinomycetota bacterium]
LAETVYSRFDLRAYRDLDVLVAPAAFPDALRALEAAGASLYERNWTLLRAGMKGQLHLTLPHGSFCDLHWHLLHDREVRGVYRLPSATLLGGVRRLVLGGVNVPSLDPVDAFVHLAVHACLAGADRLVWLKDVDEIVQRMPPEWEGVVEKARAAGAGLAVAAVLELVRRVLGTPAPSGVVAALDPAGGWTRMIALAARIAPPQMATGDGSILRIVARSTRPTLGGSMTELAARSLSLAHHPRSSSLQGRMALRNPSRSTSALYPSGGARERRAYLDAVTAHDEDATY